MARAKQIERAKARTAAKAEKRAAPETVVRRVRCSSGVQLQEQIAQEGSFTVAKQKTFLEALAHSANVTRSAAAAGVSIQTLYRHRQKRPAFREAWLEALDQGYERLETMLLDRALRYNEMLIGENGFACVWCRLRRKTGP